MRRVCRTRRHDDDFVGRGPEPPSRGTDTYNQALSERRADSVADYLSQGGISRGRLSTEGFGESKAVASNMNEDGRAQNRRVELRIISQ